VLASGSEALLCTRTYLNSIRPTTSSTALKQIKEIAASVNRNGILSASSAPFKFINRSRSLYIPYGCVMTIIVAAIGRERKVRSDHVQHTFKASW